LSKNLAGLGKTREFVRYGEEKGNSELFQCHDAIDAVPGDREKDLFS
jgi:hypothetical protein